MSQGPWKDPVKNMSECDIPEGIWGCCSVCMSLDILASSNNQCVKCWDRETINMHRNNKELVAV